MKKLKWEHLNGICKRLSYSTVSDMVIAPMAQNNYLQLTFVWWNPVGSMVRRSGFGSQQSPIGSKGQSMLLVIYSKWYCTASGKQ